MKVIIAGGRDFDDETLLRHEMQRVSWGWEDLEIVSGMARGADTLGAEWAADNDVPLKEFPANWDKHGRGAGIVRNAQMARYADVLIAFWDGESRGTDNMIQQALNLDCEVHVYRYKGGADEAKEHASSEASEAAKSTAH